MRKSTLAILIAAAAASLGTISAQTNTTTDSESAVWYNARRGDPDAMNQVGVWYYSGQKVQRDYDKAFDWWRRGALAGSPKAVANLGVCYQYGRGVEADSVAAICLYVDAIQQGQEQLFKQRQANIPNNLFDDMLIAYCTERGIGTKADAARAAELYSQAAARGSADAVAAAARAYAAAGNAAKALEYYDRAASDGDMQAMYHAARLRLADRSNTSQYPRAINMLRQAAQGGLPQAQGLLGMSYLSGNGVDADPNLAAQWLRKGAYGGDAQAMWEYAQLMKRDGDYDEAMQWMARAVEAAGERQFTDMLAKTGTNDTYIRYLKGMKAYLVDGDMDTAADIFRNLAKSKIEAAVVMDAVVQANPSTRKGNAQKAAKTLDRLADDNMVAAYYLAGLYLDGTGVDRSASRAIALYRQSADAGYGPAQNALADIYYAGEITAKDQASAAALYDKAYQQRCLGADGAQRMQSIYSGGAFGVAQDESKAAAMAHYDSTDVVKELLMKVK